MQYELTLEERYIIRRALRTFMKERTVPDGVTGYVKRGCPHETPEAQAAHIERITHDVDIADDLEIRLL